MLVGWNVMVGLFSIRFVATFAVNEPPVMLVVVPANCMRRSANALVPELFTCTVPPVIVKFPVI